MDSSFVSAFHTQQPRFPDFRLNLVVAAAALPQSLRLAKTGPLFSQSHHNQEETGPQGLRGLQVRKCISVIITTMWNEHFPGTFFRELFGLWGMKKFDLSGYMRNSVSSGTVDDCGDIEDDEEGEDSGSLGSSSGESRPFSHSFTAGVTSETDQR